MYNKDDDLISGLSDLEARERLEEYGKNSLEAGKRQTAFSILLDQFKDAMVLVLLAATLISALMGEIYDAVTIIIIVLLDAVLGFAQEYRTEKTVEELKKLTSPSARVLRNGVKRSIPASLIVPGDIIYIESGDRIPCDGEILSETGLWCDESILTGESESVRKETGEVYMGSSAVKGRAVIKCLKTGMSTRMGQMSRMIEQAGRDKTPLERKLASLGRTLCVICAFVCVIVTVAGILRGEPVFNMLMTGITIAIAAIPEGLPATVTIALALAVRRMLRKNALVHKLHSVETLGCTTVICSDKTGTLTENRQTVTRVYSQGFDYELSSEKSYDKASLEELIKCAVLCNNAALGDGDSQSDGDPTELALLRLSDRLGFDRNNISLSYKRLGEQPFESETKRMSVTVMAREGAITYIKGAPDVILKECKRILGKNGVCELERSDAKEITRLCDEYAKRALRVLAFEKVTPGGERIFLGLTGMIDAPRPKAKKSVETLKKAGIKTVMITGDHRLTAEAVAKELGILRPGGLSISKQELDIMSDRELSRVISRAAVFSRVDPADKLRIVKAFRNAGHIVAMTGDGVNDAPAVKDAHIGAAMGRSGTDACRQAADIILMDDDFSTLCEAVREGRTIYSNIRKFVRYLISCNIGEVIVMLLSIVTGLPVILLPAQILLVNLATDGLPAIALGLEPSEGEIMKKSPREFQGSFFASGLIKKIVVRGLLIGVCTLLCFAYSLHMGLPLESARTCALVTLIASQLIHVFECRSEERSVFRLNPLKNLYLIGAVVISAAVTAACIYIPALARAIDTVPLSYPELAWSVAFSACIPIISGLLMLITRKETGSPN